ncbi:hypothetical protein NliqN6_1800 [Naganishia liquefaciens]|uniref:DNA repair protein n=1 Tax=Naganishia liquefaciens TaxID=104408 RepID=A0A8H3TR71_9TREE|nr:hypothetical protein NliqN6_1800 [Naganishia liquefaciens]
MASIRKTHAGISCATMLAARRDVLETEIAELLKQLGPDVDAQAVVQNHIELLHVYNEIKDGAQALIGQYTMRTGATIKDVHERLGLSLTE